MASPATDRAPLGVLSGSSPAAGAAASAGAVDRAHDSMYRVDVSSSERIGVLMQMVRELSLAAEPKDVLMTFARGRQRLVPTQGYISLSTRGLEPGQYRITRMYLTDDIETWVDTDPWKDFDSLAVHEGGLLGDIVRTANPQLIRNLHLDDDPVLGDALKPFGALSAVPLFDGGDALNWAVSLYLDPKGIEIGELEESLLRGNLVGGTVRQVLTTSKLRDANQRIRHEVDRIANIQKALLPDVMPDIPGMSLAASYETFDQAGGDYYDFIRLDPASDQCASTDASTGQRWAFIVADASGHGPAAAVMMAMLHAIVHAYPKIPCGPGEVLRHVNAHLARKCIESSFITAFIAIYDSHTRQLRYARAGHNPPLIKNPGSGAPVRLLDEVGSIPLGILGDTLYEDASVTLEPGQSLVMYTDGITEAMNAEHQMFGTEGIERSLIECSGRPECVVQSIAQALADHTGGVRAGDDQTLVIARVDD